MKPTEGTQEQALNDNTTVAVAFNIIKLLYANINIYHPKKYLTNHFVENHIMSFIEAKINEQQHTD